ncbi:MAG: GtrA family protein [Candidatus Pristimantibacillus sp.]
MKRYLNKEISRYVIVGLLNTAITYLSYLLMLMFFSYSISYLISYVIGILFSYVLNSKIVFNTNMTLWKLIQYPLVYITQFLFGLLLMYLLIDKIALNDKVAPLIVSIISLPITFVVSKFILSGKLGNLFTVWMKKLDKKN